MRLVHIDDLAFPVFGRGETGVFLKALSEVIAVGVPHHGRDFRDFIAGICEEFFGFFHAIGCDILVQSLPGFILKIGAQIRGGKMHMVADDFDGQILVGIVLAYEIPDQKNSGIFAFVRLGMVGLQQSVIISQKKLLQLMDIAAAGNQS